MAELLFLFGFARDRIIDRHRHTLTIGIQHLIFLLSAIGVVQEWIVRLVRVLVNDALWIEYRRGATLPFALVRLLRINEYHAFTLLEVNIVGCWTRL